jgi:hypothetical protein
MAVVQQLQERVPVATLIRVANRLKDKVTLGGRVTGGGFDPDLLRQAEERIEAMREVFMDAAQRDIARLAASYRDAQAEPAECARHLDAVERLAHDIKGYGSHIGYDLLTAFADSLSLFLRKAAVGDDVRLAVAGVHVDALCLVLREHITGDGGEQGAKLAQGLRGAVGKYLSSEDH